MGIRDWFRRSQREAQSASTSRIPTATPAPAFPRPSRQPAPKKRPAARSFKIVDIPGNWDRNVVGTHHFEETVEALPLGPLKVTLRHKPNPDNPHAIAAFVGRQQVGWLSTDWSANDPHVVWVKRLEAIGVRPRFYGECKLSEVRRDRKVVFLMPGRDDEPLDEIVRRLTDR
jgi:hypothetical protein